ncbi:TetR/AcrR family transcriptional regulator [Phytohabitans aurantiacus]|uniref:HTH-type transcriptional regulator n=1 Tax=Phytohabitans aurantiacus TaxID=3016789 RepID=A0ABQ5RAW4_9ACTN|nr:TetR family transcriptional regulator [Phytohabitans aurantiacus]GLI03553.1 putative HTH-type transcriptional regulator [Phytohabitans aurantiacus]
MTEQGQEARQRMVAGAADMIRRRGLNATSVRELTKHSAAPLGSTYHYFPGGKQELAAEAVRYAGSLVSKVLRRELAAGPVEGLRAFLALWRQTVLGTDFQAGCPVLAVAIEEPPAGDRSAVAAAAEVFADWEALMGAALGERGVAAPDAARLATLVVAAVEGSVALCRAKRDIAPLDAVATQLEAVLSAAVAR